VRAIQRTQFYAKDVKNDLNPTNLVKRNFCFETEGVCRKYIEPLHPSRGIYTTYWSVVEINVVHTTSTTTIFVCGIRAIAIEIHKVYTHMWCTWCKMLDICAIFNII
jgi:hypothetical protein